jgi:hypothetical protein
MRGLLAGSPLEQVASGATWAEGPVWLPERQAVRYSDVVGNRILEYSEATGELTVHSAAAQHANGRTLDLDGTVVQCSHGRRAVERDHGRTTTTLVDRWNGRRLNSPNDVVVKSDGTIWFSDPSYAIQKEGEGHPGEAEYGDHVVFRFDPRRGTRPGGHRCGRGWRKGMNRNDASYLRLNPDVVGAHLVGDVFIGVYPLLTGNTCRFLVADFDGSSAMLDALAYAKAAR